MMRERKKKQKADEKRQRKLERKAAAEAGLTEEQPGDVTSLDEEESSDPADAESEINED